MALPILALRAFKLLVLRHGTPPCRLSNALELAQHQLALLEERMKGSEAAQLADAVAATEREVAEAQQAVQGAQARKKEMAAAAKV